MQARAIFEAACQIVKEGGNVVPEVMIPLIGTVEELKDQAAIVRRVAEETKKAKGVELEYMVGTMIEIPRAALTAARVAEEAEFFSFGTNDLTQMTYGYSRDDAGKFLPEYVNRKILPGDPFVSVDQEGVGMLMDWAVKNGRSTRPKLKVGICGEHGGDPASVEFWWVASWGRRCRPKRSTSSPGWRSWGSRCGRCAATSSTTRRRPGQIAPHGQWSWRWRWRR